jgi:hypothetical protein
MVSQERQMAGVNDQLERMTSRMDMLTEITEAASGIITTRGYGKSSPRVPGTSAEARAKNRRVEIGIVDVALDMKGEVRSQ